MYLVKEGKKRRFAPTGQHLAAPLSHLHHRYLILVPQDRDDALVWPGSRGPLAALIQA